MSPETVLVALYFLFPGLVTLAVFDWIFVGRERRGVELATWAIGVSFLAAIPLVLIPKTQPLVSYLWDPSALSRENLLGVLLHVLTGVALAVVAAAIVRKVLDGRLGPWSFYQRSGDWLWGRVAGEPRFVMVETKSDRLFGDLAFADDPGKGSDLILGNPGIWNEEAGDFYRNGMRYAWIPASEITRVEVSIADPPAEQDYPYYESGYVDDTFPIRKEQENGRQQEEGTREEGVQREEGLRRKAEHQATDLTAEAAVEAQEEI